MKNKYIGKKSLIIVITILVIYSILAIAYVDSVKEHVEYETYEYLSEVTKQGCEIVKTQIEAQFQVLKSIARFIENHRIFNENEILDMLKYEVEENYFKRMGVIDLNGNAIMTDGYKLNLGDREYFLEALKGNTSISNTLEDRIDNNRINVYATPLYRNGEVYGVLFATHSTDVFKELLSVTFFGGEGYSYIIQKNGDAVVSSNHPNSSKDFNNIFEFFNGNADKKEWSKKEFKKNLLRGKNGNINYTYDGIKRYMSYEPLGINDWWLYLKKLRQIRVTT